MVCLPVRRDNPRALASGLSTVQADKLSSISLVACTQYRLARYTVSRAKDLSVWGLCYKITTVIFYTLKVKRVKPKIYFIYSRLFGNW